MTDKTSYYAVIFTSVQNEKDPAYDVMAEKMTALARQQSGFLGIEFARSKVGITVSYWESLEAIKRWKQHSEHLEAQRKGKTEWYKWYKIRICKIEREYAFGDLPE